MDEAEKGIYLNKNVKLNSLYKIKKVISRSELAIIYLAVNVKSKEIQIIKEFFPKLLAVRDLDRKTVLCRLPSFMKKFNEFMELFLQEARIIKEVDHRNIVAYYDHFQENGTCYLVMEYCEGTTLDKKIKEKQKFSLSCFLNNTILPLIDTLDYLHQTGIIHRDIKPSNIMIRKDGQPIILDFGSAIYYKKQKSYTMVTTTGFSPLEFYSNRTRQGEYSDIYSLTATLYYILSGEIPMDVSERLIEDKIKNIRKYNRKVSRLLTNVIMWGLAMNYKKRCPSLKYIRIAIYFEYLFLKIKRS